MRDALAGRGSAGRGGGRGAGRAEGPARRRRAHRPRPSCWAPTSCSSSTANGWRSLVDLRGARAQLLRLRGRRHRLVSAVVAFRGGAGSGTMPTPRSWTCARSPTPSSTDYLAAAGPDVLGCVGAYQIEGLGAQLMARVEGDLPTVLGMPLLPLLQFLRDQGVLRDVIVLGLTGSIAMGKSRAAARFRAFGVPVFDSDAQVHALFASRAARRSRAVAQAFPGSLGPAAGSIAQALGRMVLGPAGRAAPARGHRPPAGARRASAGSWPRPAARGRARRPRRTAALRDRRPSARVDAVALVCASAMLQAQRALRRPGMTAVKLAQIRGRAVARRLEEQARPIRDPLRLRWRCAGQACRRG